MEGDVFGLHDPLACVLDADRSPCSSGAKMSAAHCVLDEPGHTTLNAAEAATSIVVPRLGAPIACVRYNGEDIDGAGAQQDGAKRERFQLGAHMPNELLDYKYDKTAGIWASWRAGQLSRQPHQTSLRQPQRMPAHPYLCACRKYLCRPNARRSGQPTPTWRQQPPSECRSWCRFRDLSGGQVLGGKFARGPQPPSARRAYVAGRQLGPRQHLGCPSHYPRKRSWIRSSSCRTHSGRPVRRAGARRRPAHAVWARAAAPTSVRPRRWARRGIGMRCQPFLASKLHRSDQAGGSALRAVARIDARAASCLGARGMRISERTTLHAATRSTSTQRAREVHIPSTRRERNKRSKPATRSRMSSRNRVAHARDQPPHDIDLLTRLESHCDICAQTGA